MDNVKKLFSYSCLDVAQGAIFCLSSRSVYVTGLITDFSVFFKDTIMSVFIGDDKKQVKNNGS
ncbi:hypothetical protein GZ78_27825 [Endozoicomonas numazuensis]|uniref:Uncharacterized protein n=1 Tax=Endozoicomonas numazuensis TaxID=1137799 RepID=A0A081N1B6_9GAMM|nr:hypothetical protein GZ78_27825 [Endozoicomonas numazuensis]